MQFADQQKTELLTYARQTLTAIIKAGRKHNEECPDSSYLESAGVFVSLHKGEELRGCIGYIEPISTIWDAIRDNTISASTKDIRFSEVSEEEVEQIKIEISILTPSRECQLEEIEEGKHGVVIEQGQHKATYLPQVWGSLPNKEVFFSSLCQKAGLDTNCWHDKDTKFYKYETITFTEK
ncbi:AmmeMemoRadiSam system protein A [Candidatus Kuenenbacteria bacterium]|nr:AmmeMemoRadiSam system protein A [Candidatus Kuenenbacteria bacterium]